MASRHDAHAGRTRAAAARQVPQPSRHGLHRSALGRRSTPHAPSLAPVHAREQRSIPPRQQTSVLQVVRPTADHPQLPDITEAASENLTLPKLYNERGRLLMPAALVGSHEILVHQNDMATADGLGRIQDDADLDAMRLRGMLVGLPVSGALTVDPKLPFNRRYARPWVIQFLQDLAREHSYRFHTPIQVNSAVRTVAFQQQLIHRNGNAAPAEGDTASPHLTGQAVDLAKHGMSLPEIAWMRGYLLPLIDAGKIDVEEEFRQSCFHISVYRRYAPQLPDVYNVASRGVVTAGSPPATAQFR